MMDNKLLYLILVNLVIFLLVLQFSDIIIILLGIPVFLWVLLQDNPDKNIIAFFSAIMILTILFYRYYNQVFTNKGTDLDKHKQIIPNQDTLNQYTPNQDNIEGFASSKLKKLKQKTTGKVSDRFGNILMGIGKGKNKKEPFDDTNPKMNFGEIYKSYKESFNPIINHRSKNLYESYGKMKKMWKKLYDIF